MTKFNSEKYEQFLEDKNTLSSIGFIDIFDERGSFGSLWDQGYPEVERGSLG